MTLAYTDHSNATTVKEDTLRIDNYTHSHSKEVIDSTHFSSSNYIDPNPCVWNNTVTNSSLFHEFISQLSNSNTIGDSSRVPRASIEQGENLNSTMYLDEVPHVHDNVFDSARERMHSLSSTIGVDASLRLTATQPESSSAITESFALDNAVYTGADSFVSGDVTTTSPMDWNEFLYQWMNSANIGTSSLSSQTSSLESALLEDCASHALLTEYTHAYDDSFDNMLASLPEIEGISSASGSQASVPYDTSNYFSSIAEVCRQLFVLFHDCFFNSLL